MSTLTLMTKLDLSNNMLSRISVVMGAWQRLEYLDMSGNVISELPQTLGNLRRLQTLRLGNNKLTALPPYMIKLTNMTELFLGGNELQELFTGVDRCGNLKRLALDNNLFPCLPYELARITTLRELSMEGNPLVSPPPEIRDRGTGKVMDYLKRFDEATKTHHLQLDRMGLLTFPLEIVALSQLKSLDIAANEIQSLPSVIGKMAGLELLRVDHNKILQLPVEMGSIFSLREFTFEGNELRTPPLEVLEHSTHAILEYLKRMQVARKTQALDLRALELRRTPVEVAFMTGLTSLSLENNKINKLFVGVGQLTLLSELLLDYNELQTLPRTVANLTNLTKLSLAHNKIKHMSEWLLPRLPLRTLNACDNLIQELPFSLLKFTSMTALNVDMNPFTDPPREVVVAGQKQIFRYLQMLQNAGTSNVLDLSHLGLLHFPPWHCKLTTLTALKLDYNLLESLPKDIEKLLKLEVLSVKNNKLTHLPLELGYLRRLKTLETAGNDLKTPPPEVCKAGAQLAVTFLANVLHAAESKQVELKQMTLAAVPEIVFEQTSITRLDLSDNLIISLPPQLLLMSTLRELVLNNNKLKELPEDIGEICCSRAKHRSTGSLCPRGSSLTLTISII